MLKNILTLLLLSLAGAVCDPVSAQQPIPGFDNAAADRQQRIGDNHYILIGNADVKMGDTELYADRLELFIDQDRAVATGNVLLAQGANRIAADRADFNTKTKLGTFYNASGLASVKPQRARPGAIALPAVSSQETDVYFYGEAIEKIGLKKYKITKGGFTTCVQPTPRWMLTSSTVILNLDHYTFLRDAVFTVKGVPMLYLPILYYPTKKEDRATGFLIPTYGSSTLRGQTLHNAFFWAIDRSQDATFLYDWFSKTGQGGGSEYRYNFGGGSDGNFRTYVLNETDPTGGSEASSTRSYEIRGSANQMLPGRFRARGRVDYFSSLTTMQTFNTNYFDAYRNQRSYGGNVVGAWGMYSLNGTMDRIEYFSSSTFSSVSGSWPRVSLSRNERPLAGTPLYFSMSGEYAGLLRETKDTENALNNANQDVTRLDFTPQVRFPFKKWQWFTINSSLGWRETYYTRSLDPLNNFTVVDSNLNRQFFTAQAQLSGPVFTKVWDTPDNGYAEKFKHSIEPFLNLQRTSTIDNSNQIIKNDSIDTIVGGTTQYSYGVTNRFYAKRREGQRSLAREIVDVMLTQTYYTQAQASQYDPQYSTSFTGAPPSNFSPILLSVRAMPTNEVNVALRAEVDSRYLALRQISAGGGYSWTGRVQLNASWSKKAFIAQLPGYNDPNYLDQSINLSSNVHTKDNRLGGTYSFSFDALHSTMLQQRVSAFYNAQCCGVAAEYQTFNFGGVSAVPGISQDHRFFLSFTLAGLGNFSPFNGVMSGIPR
jgi:LPS-assembly protein